MDIVQAIYSNPVAAWVRESNALLAFTGLLFLHAVGLAFAAGVSAVIDLRLLGVAALPVGWAVAWIARESEETLSSPSGPSVNGLSGIVVSVAIRSP